MTPNKKAAARSAPPAPPAPPEVVVTVTGANTVDGVAPGGQLPVVPELARLRYLITAGHVSVTVGDEFITDGAIVARIEGA